MLHEHRGSMLLDAKVLHSTFDSFTASGKAVETNKARDQLKAFFI